MNASANNAAWATGHGDVKKSRFPVAPSLFRHESLGITAFARYDLDLLRSRHILDVARHLIVSWTFFKINQKKLLCKYFNQPRLKNVRDLGMDEVQIGKGYRYVTVGPDLERGAVLFWRRGRAGARFCPSGSG